jgi:phosphoribosyl 1,2-cyclic phosphodiesterase/DNA-binding response OmpR family regulator
MKSPVRVKFWGTRGSLAKPGARMQRYGGNTSCVQVTSPGGSLVIIDCGTGAHDLGRALLAEAKGPLRGSILISHTHWDHIQGFPFFAPLFVPGGNWNIYGPAGLGQSLRDTLAGQMEHTYFPITLDQMGASIHFHDLVEGHFEIDDIRLTTRYLNHPALTLGYRLEMGGAAVVYSCDYEPYSRHPGEDAQSHPLDREHGEFLTGADLVIHDAQFTDKEYVSHKGWGHSPSEFVCELGHAAGVKRMALSHHDPERTDDAMDQVVAAVRNDLKAKGSSMYVFGAAEGQVIEFEPAPATAPASAEEDSAIPASPALTETTVLIGISQAKWSHLLVEAAQAEGVQTILTTDAESTLLRAREGMPELILLEHDPAGIDGLSVCRALREEQRQRLQEVPIILVAGREDPSAGIAAGVTQWLITPFTSQYARAQIQASLLRTVCRWARAPLPLDEEERVIVLRGLSLLDTAPEERFDRVTRLASAIGDVPIALVTLVDQDRQWFKSCLGLEVSETSREPSFCAHTVLSRAPLVVPDTFLDQRFADNPHVVGHQRIRFYAGFPIVHDKKCIGTLCLMDTRPRQLSHTAVTQLQELAALVQEELEPRANLRTS